MHTTDVSVQPTIFFSIASHAGRTSEVSEDAAYAEGVDDLWPPSANWKLLAYALRDLGFNHEALRKCGLLC